MTEVTCMNCQKEIEMLLSNLEVYVHDFEWKDQNKPIFKYLFLTRFGFIEQILKAFNNSSFRFTWH